MKEEKIEQLKINLDNVWAAEEILTDIWKSKNPWYIIPLLNLLDNEEGETVVMDLINTTLESYTLDIYCEKLIESLPHFYIKSPEWCETLHIRIFNKATLILVYEKRLKEFKDLSADQKKSIQEMLLNILKRFPKRDYDFNSILEFVEQ